MTRDELFDEVIRNLETPIGTVTFPAALEGYYRTFQSAERRRSVLIASAIGLVILNLFILNTWLMGAETMRAASFLPWLGSMVAINALIVSGMVVFALSSSHRVRDITLQVLLTIVAALTCWSIWIDTAPTARFGLFCFPLMTVACSTLAPLYFRQALLVSLVAIGFFGLLLVLKPEIDALTTGVAALLLLSLTAMALWSNWRNDRSERMAFLLLTRERLLSERSRRRNAELLEMSIIDPLTGIANRRAFEDRFARLATLRRIDGETLAVMMVDIDHFKAFNDHYGHLDGDHCLRRVAQTLAEQMRAPDDFVARLGGEEFVVLAPGLDRAGVEPVVERLRRAIERLAIPHAGIRGQSQDVVTVSIGCTVTDIDGVADPRRVLTEADRALYAAKHAGRNRWRIAEDLGGGPTIDRSPMLAAQ